MVNSPVIERWHKLIAENDPAGLDDILAEDVVFHSPIVHPPQQGKAIQLVHRKTGEMLKAAKPDRGSA